LRGRRIRDDLSQRGEPGRLIIDIPTIHLYNPELRKEGCKENLKHEIQNSKWGDNFGHWNDWNFDFVSDFNIRNFDFFEKEG
jgi:hypothetical protein